MAVWLAHRLEDLCPGLLRIVQHKADQLHIAVFPGWMRTRCAALRGPYAWLWVCVGPGLGEPPPPNMPPRKLCPVTSEMIEQDDEADDADTAPAAAKAEPAASAGAVAPVFDVAAYAAWGPVHSNASNEVSLSV